MMSLRVQLYFLIYSLVLLLGWMLLSGAPPLMDETLHLRQVVRFASGDFTLYRRLEMLPTFHFIYASWTKLVGSESIQSLRFFTLLWSMCLFAAAWYGSAKAEAASKVWQIFTLPILFPYLFLVYTDVPALVFLVLAFALVTQRKPKLACAAMTTATLLRQNHLVWFPFVIYLACVSDVADRKKRLFQLWYFFLPPVGFVAYFLWHGGVSIQVPAGVAEVSMHPGNLIFLLALLPVLFFPLFIERSNRLLTKVQSLKIVLFVVTVWALSFYFFSALHPFNKFSGHLRTYLFLALEVDPVAKAGFAALAASGALFLVSELFEKRVGIVLAISSVLALYPLKLVEVRYLLPTVVLGVLLKRESSLKWARVQGIYGLALSALMFVGMVCEWWFW